jgi:hypothetical protein
VQIGGENQLQVIRNGQPELFPDKTTRPALNALKPQEREVDSEAKTAGGVGGSQDWFALFGAVDGPEEDSRGGTDNSTAPVSLSTSGLNRYAIREGVPRRLRKERIKQSIEGLEEAIVANVGLTAEVVLDGLRRAVEVMRVETALFDDSMEHKRTQISATLDRQATESEAQQLLLDMSGIVHPQTLDKLLLQRIASELRQQGRSEAENADEVEFTLAMVLVQHKRLLPVAHRRALAAYVEVLETEPLPPNLVSDSPLPESLGNIYGRIPPGLNAWEIAFAEWLDTEAAAEVNWWHRNPVKKGESVVIALPDGAPFFPDFVISVKGRKKLDGILLVDTKRAINDDLNAVPKTVVQHREYGRTMILKKEGKRWMTVRYNEVKDKNEEDQVLHPHLLAHFV